MSKNTKKESVFLVSYDRESKESAEISLEELKSLSKSAGKTIFGHNIQIRKNIDPRYLIGKGKLKEVILEAKYLGAETIIFSVELSPAQLQAITDETTLNIIDKSQLILEIFEDRATTREGKIQVKLAEMRYHLPRLRGRGIEFSQLGGGIGTRGPGEKKLEEQRRIIRKQIDSLEKQIQNISHRRKHTRKRRSETGIPTVSLVGYTNVGKSTLFNTLTHESVKVQNKLFSTLSPTTRKIMLPSQNSILVTDTVGFISGLPEELINAFRATLEELGEANLLLHIVDANDPDFENKIDSVENIIESMGFNELPRILVFNKRDVCSEDRIKFIEKAYNTSVISALNRTNINELRFVIDRKVYNNVDFENYNMIPKVSSTG